MGRVLCVDIVNNVDIRDSFLDVSVEYVPEAHNVLDDESIGAEEGVLFGNSIAVYDER
jgi:hypothetical protein